MRARDNPFSVERIERLAFRLPADLSWDSLLERLAAMNYLAAIVGSHGSGKTTFLRHLRGRLTAGGQQVHELFLNQDSPRSAHRRVIASAAQSPPDSILLLDGADHLSTLGWWRIRRIARQRRGLVVASHQTGMLPTLIQFSPTSELLRELITDLAGSDGQSLALYQKHNRNLREALAEMYDLYAAIP